jgi:Icc-related predicted phosphoesterase
MLASEPSVAGLVLLGSYCASDVTGLDIPILQVLAENDGLIDTEAVTTSASLLPPNSRSITLDGANHASFGTYGPQPGDGESSLTRTEVRAELTALILELLETD